MSHLAWAVCKSCSAPPPKKAHEGDYWTQHARNFIDTQERDLRPKTAVASKEQVHAVAVGIHQDIKDAAFADGNTTALRVRLFRNMQCCCFLPINSCHSFQF